MHRVISIAFGLGVLTIGCATKSSPNAVVPTKSEERRPNLAQSIPAEATQGSTADVRYYTVQSGDTFSSIAQRFHLSEQDLLALNPGVKPKGLQINDRLIIYAHIEHTQ
jgi:LysM repeat protein